MTFGLNNKNLMLKNTVSSLSQLKFSLMPKEKSFSGMKDFTRRKKLINFYWEKELNRKSKREEEMASKRGKYPYPFPFVIVPCTINGVSND